MPAAEFENDDDYHQWLGNNQNGFVVNTSRSRSPDYMVLHRATCHHISEPYRETSPGGFTERDYIKVCASGIGELRDWVASHGRADRTFSNECSHCRPTGR